MSEVIDEVGGKNRSFPMEIRAFGAFPTIRRPRVLWAGVEPVLALRCLKQDVEWGAGQPGLQPGDERLPSSHHRGPAPGRRPAPAPSADWTPLLPDLDFRHHIDVTSVELMRSHLSRTGARYSVVSSTALGTPESAQPNA